jgi:hypothetical protein
MTEEQCDRLRELFNKARYKKSLTLAEREEYKKLIKLLYSKEN